MHARRQRELARRRRAVLLQDGPAPDDDERPDQGRRAARRSRAGGRQGVASAHDDVQHRARRVGHAELPARLSRPGDRHRRLRRDPHRREELAALARSDARLLQSRTTTTIPSRSTTSGTPRSTGAAGTSTASDPSSVIQGVGAALAKIDDKLASGTADGTSTLQPCAGNNFTYSTSYYLGLVARRRRGAADRRRPPASPGAAVWSAKGLLNGRTFAACDDRKILLFRGGNDARPLHVGDADVSGRHARRRSGDRSQRRRAGPGRRGQRDGADALRHDDRWLAHAPCCSSRKRRRTARWSTSCAASAATKDFTSNSLTKLFRKRGSRPRRHRRFAAGLRRPAVRQLPGAQLHRLQDDARGRRCCMSAPTTACCTRSMRRVNTLDVNHGQEAWAVIPSAVLPNLYKLADDNYKRDGHQFYVDGTPVAGDVWNGSAWRTIVVGGLNAGGKGYYALDVTNPGATPTPLWEFKQDHGSCPLPAPAAMPSGIYCRLQPRPHVRQADHHQAGRQLGRHRHLGLQQRQRRHRRWPGLSSTCWTPSPAS